MAFADGRKRAVGGPKEGRTRVDGPGLREKIRLMEEERARLYEEIKETFYSTSMALADAIDKRDPCTGGHIKKVLGYSTAIAREMNLSEETVELVKISSVLHDIGKIGIEDSILRKDSPLDEEESARMKEHPRIGAEILKNVPRLKDVIPGILLHHERVDGKGYPMGLKGPGIPLVAKIISVADTFDAMTTTRPYRQAMSRERALVELENLAGAQFDVEVVRAFKRSFRRGRAKGAEGGAEV